MASYSVLELVIAFAVYFKIAQLLIINSLMSDGAQNYRTENPPLRLLPYISHGGRSHWFLNVCGRVVDR